MKLDDLKRMNIPQLSPIEIEAYAETIPPQITKTLGYFRGLEESQPPVLTYYRSPNGPNEIPEQYGYELINRIRRVNLLVPK